MAKKKTTLKKKAAKKVTTKSTSKKATKKRSVRAKKVPKKSTARKVTRTTKTVRKKTTSRVPKSLGRPRVSGSTKLDQLLKHDYEAQQIFSFLQVTTVKELEGRSPHEIIDLLTAPVVKTVDKIRKALAINNRCLSGDERFALEFQKAIKQPR